MPAKDALAQLPDPVIRIVDDDPEVLDSLKFMLECEGWRVRAYASGADFLKDLNTAEPGCLLLDVRMPDLSGPDVQRRLAALGSRLPVVFITSYADIDAAITTLKAGARDFLLKPVDPEKLLDVIRRAVDEHRLTLAGAAVPQNAAAVLARLSEQPRRALELMVEGLNDAAVAERMGLSVRTAQVYRSNVYKAFGVHSVKQFELLIPAIRAAQAELARG